MLMCLDVGNSHIFGGIFVEKDLSLSFRYPSDQLSTSDQIGIFLRAVLRENGLYPEDIQYLALCSVVPQLNYSLQAACLKYFEVPFLLLTPDMDTGLTVKIRHASEVGADRIANAVAARALFPEKDIIVVDLGTATTFSTITALGECLGGPILPGMRTAMHSLTRDAALLSPVIIQQMQQVLGTSTDSNVQAGLYFGQLGAIKEIVAKIKSEALSSEVVVLATGGFAHLFVDSGIFDKLCPDLVLQGIRVIFNQNKQDFLINK